ASPATPHHGHPLHRTLRMFRRGLPLRRNRWHPRAEHAVYRRPRMRGPATKSPRDRAKGSEWIQARLRQKRTWARRRRKLLEQEERRGKEGIVRSRGPGKIA